MIQEICHRLKEKRATLGYSIEYTVEKTKLHPSVIKDIEIGDFTKVNPTYLKGFIKIYASFLGVDLGNALEEIDSLTQPNKKAKLIRRKIPDKSTPEVKPPAFKLTPQLQRKIISIGLGLILLWVVFAAAKFAIGGIAKLFKGQPKQIETTVPETTEPIITKGQISVSLTVKRKCFLKVIVDGTLYFDGLLAKGSRETWKGKKEIELQLSDGSAVYLEVNGKAIPTLTSLRKPIKSLKITPSGISVDK